MILLNHYGIDMGTSGLILQVESRAEFLAHKIVAFALCLNRIMGHCLVRQQAVDLPLPLVVKKIADHQQTTDDFMTVLKQRTTQLQSDATAQASFSQEMRRFLPSVVAKRTVESNRHPPLFLF